MNPLFCGASGSSTTPRNPRMNREGYISCASCHLDGGSDGMVWDRTQFGEGLRNTIDLRGRRGANGGFVHWSANYDEIQDFEHDAREAFGGLGFIPDAEFREGTRDQPLGDQKAGLSQELDDLAAFVESLDRTPESPHRTRAGDLTESGSAGRAVFESMQCALCHAGADFTDDDRHDVGTLSESSGRGARRGEHAIAQGAVGECSVPARRQCRDARGRVREHRTHDRTAHGGGAAGLWSPTCCRSTTASLLRPWCWRRTAPRFRHCPCRGSTSARSARERWSIRRPLITRPR